MVESFGFVSDFSNDSSKTSFKGFKNPIDEGVFGL